MATRRKSSAADGRLRVALVQLSPALGDVERNLGLHLDRIAKARDAGARLIVFPELSLTGYFLRDVVPEVALSADSAPVRKIARAAGDAAVVLGCVEEDESHHFYNSAFLIQDGAVRFVHRKVYLPTYGMFDEQRYFAAGDRIRAFPSAFGRLGILVCEDAWHLGSGLILAADRVKQLIVLASSPTRGVSAAASASSWEAWREITAAYARFFGVFVLFVNRVGFEDGVNFWGGSRVVAPGGKTVAEAAVLDEELLLADLDPTLMRAERIFSPLGRDEKMDLTLRELARIRNGLGA
ncbi:MAG: nitrilase-related carbon-nitrogen hydrolase [Planctomycetota bacterium]